MTVTAAGSRRATLNRKRLELGGSRARVFFQATVTPSTQPAPEPVPSDAMIDTLVSPQPRYRIAGENFCVEVDGDTIYIRHPRWSLLGAGSSLLEADRDLRGEARELIEIMSAMPHGSLDAEAQQLFRFVLRIG